MPRKAVPTALKVITGNPGKRPLPKNEPTLPTATHLPAPDFLGPVGVQEWERVVKLLSRVKLITEIDTTVLEMYCKTYEQWVALEKLCASEGGVAASINHAYLYIKPLAKLKSDLLKFAIEFGMTPSSRVGLQPVDPDGNTIEHDERSLKASRMREYFQ